ncbi:hypothetical protein Hypma_014761 [Hypsizygus marmoreus]|uniref:Uncharacterized protein n=1 Tax=Hypsizygus marmoreus TaxID=39966 RepID=A0A369JFX3_HYPMA|nr:hypothetical protein Hypma_014761 [Hypsizygus marmoreus]
MEYSKSAQELRLSLPRNHIYRRPINRASNELGEWTNVEAKGYRTRVTEDTTSNILSNSKLFNVVAQASSSATKRSAHALTGTPKCNPLSPSSNLPIPSPHESRSYVAPYRLPAVLLCLLVLERHSQHHRQTTTPAPIRLLP